jgi:hypothetical protein
MSNSSISLTTDDATARLNHFLRKYIGASSPSAIALAKH